MMSGAGISNPKCRIPAAGLAGSCNERDRLAFAPLAASLPATARTGHICNHKTPHPSIKQPTHDAILHSKQVISTHRL